jgi:zinc transporter ZupT
MMAAAALVQLVGEGLDRAPGWQVWEVAAGLAGGALAYAAIAAWLRKHEEFDVMGLRKTNGVKSLLIVAVMTVHSAPEGIAIGVAFGSTEQALGWAVAAALAVHNIPEAIAITLALKSQNVGNWKILGLVLLTSVPQPLLAPPAAWLVWLAEPLLPAGLGLAAGAMVFLVIEELLPEALEKTTPALAAGWFTGGLVAMILLGRAVGL